MKIPNKPIYKAFISVKGDSSVGISDQDFTAEIYLDPEAVERASLRNFIYEAREKLREAYAFLHGETQCNVNVMFDYETD